MNVWVLGRNRARIERLCRDLLWPPLAQERHRRQPDGRILFEQRKVWRDGTTHLRLEPLELLEKPAALILRPEAHLLLYHGVLAPHGTATLCILSSNARNLEGVGIGDATP